MPNAPERVQIAVRLAPPGEISSWLIEGASFDAAGAAALWLDLRAQRDLDPYVLTASLAAVTFRSLLVLAMPDDDDGGRSERSARTLAAICRGRLVLAPDEEASEPAEDGHPPVAAGRDPDATAPDPVALVAAMQRVPGEPDSYEQRGDAGQRRRWEVAEVPAGRAAWKAAMAEAAARGVHGLILPADPRLLDILRNPDDEIDRRDLHLAAG